MEKLSFGKHVSSIYRNQSIIINKLFADYGFGSGQYLFLLKISENEGITQNELSESINIDKANTNRAVNKLEKMNFIQTVKDQHSKRNKKYCTTEEGQRMIEIIKPKLSYVTEVLTRDMTNEEMALLNKLLIKMEENVSKEVKSIKSEDIYEK